MAILRHSDISTTLDIYTQVPDTDARNALRKIEALLGYGASQDASQFKMSE